MNSRWTTVEESRLLKLIASGKTCKELSGGSYNFNRSENALELRLKKIIYDNINNKKPVEKISELLNINKDTIMQYYYSYKDYIEKQNGGSNRADSELSNSKINKLSKLNIQDKQMNGGSTLNDSFEKTSKLEEQNRKMKLILENHILKDKLTKLLKNKNNSLYKDAINALIG
jgi:hypothetical protein